MQGMYMEGPIPSNISRLTNLEELRISDLKGSSIGFPHLQDLKMLRYLVLRNCLNITSSIPVCIGELTELEMLSVELGVSFADSDAKYIGRESMQEAMRLGNLDMSGPEQSIWQG